MAAAGPLTPDDWEKVRLHAYQTERILHRSPFLAVLAGVAATHHERCDGSGYHRGTADPGLTPRARLLAAADTYQTKIEPRPHREALAPEQAAETLSSEAQAGRLDAVAVRAVLEAAGQRTPRIERAAGLTPRETDVIGLLARGLQTKQIARALGISVKTASTTTSRTRTARSACPRVRQPHSSRCSTGWCHRENSLSNRTGAAHSVTARNPLHWRWLG